MSGPARPHLLPLWALLLAGCASSPPPPDWQMNAKASLEAAGRAYLSGDSRVEAQEFARARAELARTGRAELLARAELTRCATRVASLDFDACPGFTPALAQDAGPAERAYAAYLAGRAHSMDIAAIALLPAAQREAAGAADPELLRRLPDPLSALVAAGVQLRGGRASPALMALAIEIASAQGWRRPLLAWLQLQAGQAERDGQVELAAQARRRIALVLGEAAP